MSFQAYIDNIKAKTGKTPEEFKKLAEKEGLLQPGVKAGAIVAWLKREFGLGHGHAMTIYATFKGRGSSTDEVLKLSALGLWLKFFIHYRGSINENEYLCEFLWQLRRGLPVLREASRSKSRNDDDARAVARPKPRQTGVEGRRAACTHFGWRH
jgi:Domain of unknown function (DUF4287)